MSDRFFDKDNNFILWKDEGDLTKASKYQGGNRGGIGLSESLTKKIAKGKVEVGRKFGYLNKPMVVNWGKCGGTSDVVVTYKEGDPLWIPNAFLLQGTNGTSNQPKPDALYLADGTTKDTSVGYKTWFGEDDHDGVTTRQELGTNGLYIAVYKLPQELGEWLYENAESNLGEHLDYYGSGTTSHSTLASNYKGIAIYPDSPTSWTSSQLWGVGIRKKEDIPYLGMLDGEPTYFIKDDNTGDYSAIFDLDQWKALEDDAYYLVAQESGKSRDSSAYLTGQLQLWDIDDAGSDHIYFRHYNTMTSYPSANNKGSKYFLPKEKFQHYGVITKALEVNWGKCGGNDDVIVTYGEGDPLWIPKVFFTGSTYLGKSGLSMEGSFDTAIRIYTLPQEIGKYLYGVAESNSTNIMDYGTETSSTAISHNYKGIAIYSDNPSNWTSPADWGVGIRTIEDIDVTGHKNGALYRVPSFNKTGLSDGVYYMVLENRDSTGANTILTRCSASTVDDGTPTSDHIYLRTYRELTAVPSASNMGSKYTCPSELCSDMTTLTEHTDSLTVNWGKCGGNEDVIVTYNKGEGIWIPKSFIMMGMTPTELTEYTDDKLFLGDGTTKDTSVGYKTWFGANDKNSKTTRQNRGESAWINIYKLPQLLGEWLYNNAESNLGTHLDYSTGNSSSNEFDRNYKGIAIYPDTLTSGGWTNSNGWGVGIRKKSDLMIIGYLLSNNTLVTSKKQSSSDYSCVETYSQYKALEDDAYYLVCQCFLRESGTLDRVYDSYFGDNIAYLRHYNTMTAKPNGSDNMGEKYIVTDDLLIEHPSLPTPNEDQVEIDWGCGIKTYYKYGEPMYIPRAFLMEAFDPNTKTPKGTSTTPYGNGSVGYYCWDDLSTYKIAVYVLPQELGKYLYESAESITTGTGYYGAGNYDWARAFKGIAIYPDHVGTDSSSDWTTSGNWAVGIRTGEDILVYGHMSNGVQVSCGSSTQPSGTYEDDVYYLVAQLPITSGDTSTQFLYGQLNLFPKDEPIWLRHFKDMTSNPSADNKGKKMVYHPEYYAKPLGGKIFYIDPTDNGATYTFFDSSGNVVSGSTVAELSNAVSYLVEGTPSKDKFYVYYPTKYDSLQWGYNGTATGASGIAIGTGKTNTATVMSRTDIPSSSIWSKLSEVRNSSEIDDWFIPSKDEIDKFREADLEVWHRGSGGSYLWASTEMEGYNAWYWMNNGNNWSYQSKTNPNYSVFFTRSF